VREKDLGRLWAGLVSGVWVLLLFVAVFGVALNAPDGNVDLPITRELNSSSKPLSTYYSISASSEPPAVEWNKTYGGMNYEGAYSVQQTTDGGYIVVGATYTFGAGSMDVWLVKIDAGGTMQWSKTYGGSNWDGAYSASVQQTADDGYIIASSTSSFGVGKADFWLIKTDVAGNMLWNKTYGGVENDEHATGRQTFDGGYIIVGTTHSFGDSLGDVWLVKTDSAGNMLWNKTYGEPYPYGEDGRSVQQTNDGGYVIAGYDGKGDILVIKADSGGNLVWKKSYGGSNTEYAWSVQQTSDSGYTVAGWTASFGAGGIDAWFIKTDATGNIQWNKTYTGSEAIDEIYSVQPTIDGGYILAGFKGEAVSGKGDFWLIKTDNLGSVEWNQTYGGSDWECAYSVEQTNDGGYIVAGETQSFGAGGGVDFWLIKLAPEQGPGALIEDWTPQAWIGLAYLKYMLLQRGVTPVNLTRPITADLLHSFRILVITGLTVEYGYSQPYSSSEISAIKEWVSNGGSLLLDGDQHAWDQLNALSREFGIGFLDNVIQDPTNNYENDPRNPLIHVFYPHPVTYGLSQIVFAYGSSMVISNPAMALGFTDEDSVPANSPVLVSAQFGVGRVVAIGDGNAINDWGVQTPFDNMKLLRNMVDLLTARDDLSIVDVSPIQVILDAEALIADKRSAVRVDVLSTFPERVWAEIKITYDFARQSYTERGRYGNGTPIHPGLNRIYIAGGPALPGDSEPWQKPNEGQYLYWTSAGTDNNIKALIDPYNRVAEANETNNEKTISKKIVETSSLSILFVPVRFPDDPQGVFDRNILIGRMQTWLDFLRAVFPSSEVRSYMLWPPDVGPSVPDSPFPWPSWPRWLYMNVAGPWARTAEIWGYDRVVILIHNLERFYPPQDNIQLGEAIGMGCIPEDRVPVVIDPDLFTDEWAVAHEVGHTYYLWHPWDFGPAVYDAQRFWVAKRDYETELLTLMTYGSRTAGQYMPSQNLWIDKGRYDSDVKHRAWWNPFDKDVWNLLDQFRIGSDPEIVLVNGVLFKNGTAAIDSSWYRLSGTLDLYPEYTGNFSVALLDNNFQVLGEFHFNASFQYFVDNNGNLMTLASESVPFAFKVPFIDGTATIQIRNATDHILASRIVTSNSPAVSVTFPNGGEILAIGGNYTITWDAFDVDGDSLSYTIAYSDDEGLNWTPLAAGLHQKNYIWDTTVLSTASKYLIKVIATDGVNTGEDVSNSTFTVMLDLTRPITTDDYDGLWHTEDFTITLTASDNFGDIQATYYKINNDPEMSVQKSGQPYLTTEGSNNKLEYWSIDVAGNEETPHKILTDIKLDKTKPTANAGSDQIVHEDTLITLNGSSSWDNIGIQSYIWTFTDATTRTLLGANPKYTFATPGSYNITLKIIDEAGNYAIDIVEITVHDITKPVANAGLDQMVNEDTLVTCDGSMSSDNVGITAYTWTFTDMTIKTLTGAKPTYTFNTPGVYTITLNVTDASGNWATNTMTITVQDSTKPIANAGQNQTVNVGAKVIFDGGGSSDNVGIVSYEWNFGDGATGTGIVAVHAYTNPGIYAVTLIVEDAANNTATHQITVTVLTAEAFPLWVLGATAVTIAIAVTAVILWRRRK
jgi:PKD repeat protein